MKSLVEYINESRSYKSRYVYTTLEKFLNWIYGEKYPNVLNDRKVFDRERIWSSVVGNGYYQPFKTRDEQWDYIQANKNTEIRVCVSQVDSKRYSLFIDFEVNGKMCHDSFGTTKDRPFPNKL